MISSFEDLLIAEFLHQKGQWMRWLKIIDVYGGGGDQLPDVEHAITQLDEDGSANSREHRVMMRAKQETRYDLRDGTPGTARTGPGAVERWCPHRQRRMTWALLLGSETASGGATLGSPARRDALQVLEARPATPRSYTATSSAIFLAMSSMESSSVLSPLREPRSGLTDRISS